MKEIYLIRNSTPFIEIDNYSDYNINMILSSIVKDNSKKLCEIEELNNVKIKEVYYGK